MIDHPGFTVVRPNPASARVFNPRIHRIAPICITLDFAKEHLDLAAWLHLRAKPFFCKPLKCRVRPVYFNFENRITLEVLSL